ncbi:MULTISPECIES: hypothetical protein [Spirosoma]|uniref:Uncharacterized protein n=1 Tax=Spirosoma liriopis TaxID=2937440 RepID=A0ABT0HU06_9BACT|nr:MULTISPECIES: hypothetical protein [Spirosoma]MCK8495624.1 hypothetical protein [Spirosoma liriopis]UHG94503.1 hypothetical protein LQ777_28355 [Spirosoma oryzicola]
MRKQTYIQQAANWAKAHGFIDIMANADGYPTPGGYGRQQDGLSFIPDVTGKQFEQKSYFEVILKTSPVDELLSKLKLLSQLALLSGGELYLLAPKGHLPFAKSVAIQSRITANWVILA